MLLATFLLFFASKFRKILFIVITTIMYYYYVLSDLVSLSPAYYVSIIYRTLPVIIVSPILYYASGFKAKITKTPKKNILFFLIPSFLPATLYIHNFLSFHMITESYLSMSDSIVSKAAAFFTNVQSFPLGLFAGNVTDYFHWNAVFLSAALGGTFLVPLVIGFLSIIYRIKKKSDYLPSAALIWFIVWLLMWSINFQGSYMYADIRRMYYVVPLFAVIIAEGVCMFSKILKVQQNAFYFFLFYVFFMLAYMRAFFEPATETFALFGADLSLTIF